MSEQVVNEAYSGFVRCEEEREAVSEAWEASVLPLNYHRSTFLIARRRQYPGQERKGSLPRGFGGPRVIDTRSMRVHESVMCVVAVKFKRGPRPLQRRLKHIHLFRSTPVIRICKMANDWDLDRSELFRIQLWDSVKADPSVHLMQSNSTKDCQGTTHAKPAYHNLLRISPQILHRP